MKAYILLAALLGLAGGLGWWIHCRCKVYLRSLMIKTARLRVSNRKLHLQNLQLQKQIAVRQSWQANQLNQLRPQLSELSQQAKRQLWLHGACQAVKIADSLELLNHHAACDAYNSDFSYCYRVSDIIASVRSCWQHEFVRAGIYIKRNIDFDTEMIELRDWGSDVIFNAVFAQALQRLESGQTLQIDGYINSGRVVIRFSDCGRSCARLNRLNVLAGNGEHISLAALAERTGGLLLVAALHGNVIELSWPLADPQHRSNRDSTLSMRWTHPDQEWLGKIESIVRQHFADPAFSTAQVSDFIYLSERSVQRRFKQLTQTTFKDYLHQYRLQQACEKLQHGGSVSQVAFECGFNDSSYFGLRFRQQYGLSPGQYSKQCRGG